MNWTPFKVLTPAYNSTQFMIRLVRLTNFESGNVGTFITKRVVCSRLVALNVAGEEKIAEQIKGRNDTT